MKISIETIDRQEMTRLEVDLCLLYLWHLQLSLILHPHRSFPPTDSPKGVHYYTLSRVGLLELL